MGLKFNFFIGICTDKLSRHHNDTISSKTAVYIHITELLLPNTGQNIFETKS
jgi:hypothetical protein